MKRQKIKETRKPHLWIHYLVFDDKRLKASDRCVYATLARYVDNETQQCFPSFETISERSSVSNRTVARSIQRLEKYGYISIKKDGGNVNVYTLLEPEESKYNTRAKLSPVTNNTDTYAKEHGQPMPNSTTNNTHLTIPKEQVADKSAMNDFKEVVAYYFTLIKNTEGIVPEFRKQDGAMVKNLLKRYKVGELKEIIYFYLSSKKASELGIDLSIALSAHSINQYKMQK